MRLGRRAMQVFQASLEPPRELHRKTSTFCVCILRIRSTRCTVPRIRSLSVSTLAAVPDSRALFPRIVLVEQSPRIVVGLVRASQCLGLPPAWHPSKKTTMLAA